MANQTTPAPNPGNHTTNQPPTPREPLITERLLATYFLEIITRVIPGSVFIALYANKFVTKTFTLFHESSLLLGLSLLAGAWLTGLVLDLATFTPGFFSNQGDPPYMQVRLPRSTLRKSSITHDCPKRPTIIIPDQPKRATIHQ